MRNPVESTIDGEQYEFCQLPARQSLKLLTRLMRIVGPTLGTAVNGIASGGLDIESVLDADIDFSSIVTALCDRLDENEVTAIVDELLSQVIHQGRGELSKVFDAHFSGRLPHLFKVLGRALQVEYGNFLAELPDLGAVLARAGMTQAR